MSKSTFRPPQPHTLVEQRDERGRTSSLHAAIRVAVLDTVAIDGVTLTWRSACGRVLHSTPATPVRAWDGADAHAQLTAPGARHCRGCTRVGDAIADARAEQAAEAGR